MSDLTIASITCPLCKKHVDVRHGQIVEHRILIRGWGYSKDGMRVPADIEYSCPVMPARTVAGNPQPATVRPGLKSDG